MPTYISDVSGFVCLFSPASHQSKRHRANILFRLVRLVFSRFEVRLLMVELDVSGRMRFVSYSVVFLNLISAPN